MKLTPKEIFALSHGAVRYEELEGGRVGLRRFTERSKSFYDRTNPEFAAKTRGGACIRLEFDTDAAAFIMGFEAEKVASRTFCFFDVFVDGVLVAHPGKDQVTELSGAVSLDLPAGIHRVCIYFPALFDAVITELSFPDGAAVVPVKKERKLLSVGDSITQGYDAQYPSQSYANLIADMLGATTVNLGIGAEVFNPDMLDPEMPYTPDIITVAYGTNDWGKSERADFERDAKEFYRLLRVTYPAAKIFAITPIWRGDSSKPTKVGPFEDAIKIVTDAALAQEGVVVVDGDKMIPHLPAVCSDQYLHPNDFGFKFYADALYAAMKPHLD